jgi:hypothetical protein
MNEEDSQIDGKELPNKEYLRPIKGQISIAYCPYIHNEHWGSKEHTPECQVYDVLLS